MREQGVSQVELAKRVGITQGAIGQILSGASAQSRHLPAIARELNVSVHWLEGSTDDPALMPADMSFADLQDQLGIARIQQVDIGFAMGAGTFLEDNPDVEWANFDQQWLSRITDSPPNLLFVARGIGDSMFPTLQDADVLIVDRGQARISQADRIWALIYGDMGMIKRVRGLGKGRFLIMSDNPNIPDFEAVEDELRVIGRVAWAGRKI